MRMLRLGDNDGGTYKILMHDASSRNRHRRARDRENLRRGPPACSRRSDEGIERSKQLTGGWKADFSEVELQRRFSRD